MNFSIPYTLPVLAISLLMAAPLSAAPLSANDTEKASGLYYEITLNESGDGYQVSGIPASTPDVDISLTGQVTLKVPHSDDPDKRFTATDVTNHIEGIQWLEHSRVDAPSEGEKFDYISFSFTSGKGAPTAFRWQQDEAQALFSFKNSGTCLGDVMLIANNDAFNQLPNSTDTNPGNHFSNLGWGGLSSNHYLGNLIESVACP